MDWGKLMSQHELNILNRFRILLGPEDSSVLYDLVGIAVSAERESCWNAVNDLIKHGELAEPYHSQRNGLVLASNAIRARGTP